MKRVMRAGAGLVFLGSFALYAAEYAYVTNIGGANALSFDVALNTIRNPVAEPSPYGIAMSPDGTTVYVVNQSQPYSVSIIDVVTNAITDTIADPHGILNQPQLIAITPDGKTAYVTGVTPGGDGLVVRIDLTTKTVKDTVADPDGTFTGPWALAVSPNGKILYVSNGDSISVVDIAQNKAIDTVDDPDGTFADGIELLAFTPDGKRVYTANNFPGSVSVVDVAQNRVLQKVVDTVPASFFGPVGVAVAPDGKTVYVTNYGNSRVSIIDVAQNKVLDTIADPHHTFSGCWGIGITHDGATAYVANQLTHTVSRIDLASKTALGTVQDPGPWVSVPFLIATRPVVQPEPDPEPPTNLTGVQTVKSDVAKTVQPAVTQTSALFATQVDVIDQLTWRAPAGVPMPVSYKIYSDAALVAQVGLVAGIMTSFAEHNRVPGASYTYYISPQVLTNVLSWSAPTNGAEPVEYRVYRDAGLTILAGPAVPATAVPLEFFDYNRAAGTPDTYWVVSVDASGNMSSPVSVTVS